MSIALQLIILAGILGLGILFFVGLHFELKERKTRLDALNKMKDIK